jgi:hypothetical protein
VPGAPEPGSLARVEHVARGYYRDEAATARAFRHGPLGRFAVTGDAVRKGPDGTITLLGRKAVCINTGGEKVFAEEVERVLLAHDAVADCLVVGVPSARWGHEGRWSWGAAPRSMVPPWTPMPVGRWPGTKCRSATSPWAASSASSAASPTIDGHGSVRPANHL